MSSDRDDAAHNSLDLRCRIDRAFGISREVGKAWFDAARSGDLRTMKALLSSVGDGDAAWRLAHYNGQGTSYGFVGSIALHWASAVGDVAMAEFLLRLGSSVNCQNFGGSTPLHSAVGNLQPRTTIFLLSHGASVSIVDCCGDTPVDIITNMDSSKVCSKQSQAARTEIQRALLAFQMSIEMASVPEAKWSNDQLRALLEAESRAISGKSLEPKALSIDREVCVKECRRIIASVQHAVSQAEEAGDRARTFLSSIRSREVERQRLLAEKHAAREECEHDSERDDEAVSFALQVEKAEELKRQGNDFFRQGDMKSAVKCYTAAITLNANEPAYYTNRAASHLGLGNGVLAAQDARTAIELKPQWAKGHYRLGCAMAQLGRWDSAVLCFERALELEPQDETVAESLRNALTEASNAKKEVSATQGMKRPWFDCPVCENRTRDKVESSCCLKPLCGTCWSRRLLKGCPFCSAKV
jgi:tetratricopeptide (TPR) repeat protein